MTPDQRYRDFRDRQIQSGRWVKAKKHKIERHDRGMIAIVIGLASIPLLHVAVGVYMEISK